VPKLPVTAVLKESRVPRFSTRLELIDSDFGYVFMLLLLRGSHSDCLVPSTQLKIISEFGYPVRLLPPDSLAC
jgi:hypothetical protein